MSNATSSSQASGLWHEQVMRQKYNDPQKLKDVLEKTFGPGGYQVKVKRGRYILCLPTPLREDELKKIEDQVKSHY